MFDRVVEHQKGNYLSCRGIDQVTYGCYTGVKVGNKLYLLYTGNIDSSGKVLYAALLATV
ncbi:hypothetical protein [Cardinium endosymbiont of Dermatophagoides farinae]|uniref:hypothetical protein n=1 Tax=Cardinium endosymbiont of Dermatophagoides farinae TaxID=2597823 RepID=UPI001CB8A016|nr:hypothetical protein [Cardinium endosymbiont of Dermatophagoides farinae]